MAMTPFMVKNAAFSRRRSLRRNDGVLIGEQQAGRRDAQPARDAES